MNNQKYKFLYPVSKEIYVTKRTIDYTPYTFQINGKIWEYESVEYFFSLIDENSNSNIIDIGAQTGLYSLYAKYLPRCTFFAFEPFPISCDILKENLLLNDINNVEVYNCGIGVKNEIKTLHVPLDHLGLNTFGTNPLRFDKWIDIDVPVLKLDDFIDKEINYIKCDTEGWEYNILKGGEETIEKYRPDIFLEINDINLKQCNSKKEDIFDLLKSHEYKLIDIKNDENFHFSNK
jgi:FkbM family methyltransferase